MFIRTDNDFYIETGKISYMIKLSEELTDIYFLDGHHIKVNTSPEDIIQGMGRKLTSLSRVLEGEENG